MWRPRVIPLIALSLACTSAPSHSQVTIIWNSDADAVNRTSNDQLMDAAFRFELGVFNDGFTPTAANTTLWAGQWNAAQRRNYDAANKRFSGTFDPAPNSTPFTDGKQAYIWGFRGTPAAGEWILLKAPSWQWPYVDDGPPPPPWFEEWFANDVNASAIVGQFHSSGSPFVMKSAAIANAAPPTTTWTQWQADHLAGEPLNGPNQDPDKDGTPNLLEFVFGTPPKSANAPVATPVTVQSGHVTITIPRRIDHPALLVVEVSGDLENWSSGPSHTEVQANGLHALVVRDLTPLDAAHPKRFLRLKASLPSP